MSNEIYLQIYNLLSGEWRNGSEPQKDRALFDCSLLEVDGLGALVAAGNDFSPADLAEVNRECVGSFEN